MGPRCFKFLSETSRLSIDPESRIESDTELARVMEGQTIISIVLFILLVWFAIVLYWICVVISSKWWQ